jgi:hypothetical protein
MPIYEMEQENVILMVNGTLGLHYFFSLRYFLGTFFSIMLDQQIWAYF